MALLIMNLRLFLVSFAILFTELALIRWVSTEVRVFAYLQNFVLLACFLGIGIGCSRSQKKNHLWLSPLLLALLVFIISAPLIIHKNDIPLHIFKSIPVFLAAFEDTVIHYQQTIYDLRFMQALGISLTLVMFFLILAIFIPLGQIMGKIFDEHPKLIGAYSINVVASLLGVWVFSGLSFFKIPPSVWFVMAVVFMLVLVMNSSRRQRIAGMIACLLCILAIAYLATTTADSELQGRTVWSPYQKLNFRPIKPFPKTIDPYQDRSPVGYELDVNGVGFMFMSNLSDDFRRSFPEFFEKHPYYQYEIPGPTNAWNFPYSIKKDARSVLILGGGAGDDAAAALRNGMELVDVVEIDPGIVDLGERYHPEAPYQDSRVRVIVDDARSYMNKADQRYDIVHFGLLDSHSQSSQLNNVRMDHYVYTLESFLEAKRLLEPDGLLIVSFYVQRLWLGQRVQDLIRTTFGWDPLVVAMSRKDGKGKVVMIAGHDQMQILRMIRQDEDIFPFVQTNTISYKDVHPGLPLTTDDWPYMYLTGRKIPTTHLIMVAVLLALFLFGRKVLMPGEEKIQWHFFFLGAAFLLLEFQNINKTSLIFGSTWVVNAVNFSAILVFILLANGFVARFPIKSLRWPYFFLGGWLLLVYLIPVRFYLAFDFWPRALISGVVLNLPIFFAGLIFITSFRRVSSKHQAYSSNLIGAAAGGLLEYISYLSGVQFLVLVTLILYVFSLLSLKGQR